MDYPGTSVNERVDLMITDFIFYLMAVELQGHVVYAHNLGGFDGNVLTPYLERGLFTVTHKIKANSIFRMDVRLPHDRAIPEKYTKLPNFNSGLGLGVGVRSRPVVFMDSFKKYPASLGDLAKTHEIGLRKTTFPHTFVNYERLTYVGEHPETRENP